MAKIKEEKEQEILTPDKQIESFLKQKEYKDDHLNFEDDIKYSVSSGSLLLDIEMSGGIKPGILRASGVSEGGKTSLGLAFARNFQKNIQNSMVVLCLSEGRFSDEIVERSGIDLSPEKFFLFKCNVYETVISLIRELVKNNPTNKRYFFIIDSVDALIPKGDSDRPFTEANKIAGGALLGADFLRRMALGLNSRGHICYITSQVRSNVQINPYAKSDPKLTNASGGNALLHYSNWILEVQPRYKADIIFNKDEKPIGHFCKIMIRKSPNEKSGLEIKYPIKYGRKNGTSVWIEHEIKEMLFKWEHLKTSGAWVNTNKESSLIQEVYEKFKDFPEKFHGQDSVFEYLENNNEITQFFYNKFREFYLEIKK